MSDGSSPSNGSDNLPDAPVRAEAEIVGGPPEPPAARTESVDEPAKVMRIGSMIRQLLEEVRQAPLDVASRSRLKEIYETSVHELASGLSPDLADELNRLALPIGDDPSDAEIRVAQAQLVGWLEGLFHGIQATLFAQQMAARQQIEQMNQRGLPQGAGGGGADPSALGGQYL